MEIKDYLSFEGLSHFFVKLSTIFSPLGHKHTKDEITDLEEMTAVATDDGEGNVTLAIVSGASTYATRLNALEMSETEMDNKLNEVGDKVSTLEDEVEALNTFIDDNEILVAE